MPALRAALHDAAIDVGFDQVPEYLRQCLLGWGIGHIPGDAECVLHGGGRGRIDWIKALRRFVGRYLSVQPNFAWPPRRYPDLVGVVPGKRRRGGLPNVLSVIDTSASLGPDLLELISAELARLTCDYKVTVAECDAEIQRVYQYRPICSVVGRGGTDLRPPLAPEFLRKHRPDVVIYFTDGFGPAPNEPPGLPVLWCLTPQGQQPATWGTTIRMSGLDSNPTTTTSPSDSDTIAGSLGSYLPLHSDPSLGSYLPLSPDENPEQ